MSDENLNAPELAQEHELQTAVMQHYLAGFPLIWVRSGELARVEAAVLSAVTQQNRRLADVNPGLPPELFLPPSRRVQAVAMPPDLDTTPIQLVTWDSRNGFRDSNSRPANPMPPLPPGMASRMPATPPPIPGPVEALSSPLDPDNIRLFGSRQLIVILRNFHEFLERPEFYRVRQQLQLAVEYEVSQAIGRDDHGGQLSAMRVMFVVVSPTDRMPDELRNLVRMIEVPLPSPGRLGYTLDELLAISEQPPVSDELRDQCVAQLCGLGVREAEDALSLAIRNSSQAGHRELTTAVLPDLQRAKAAVIRRNEAVTFTPPEALWGREIKGFETVDAYVTRRQLAYTAKGRQWNLPTPKGLVLLGPAGTGKSEFAQLLGVRLGFPVFKLDVGALFQKWVGASEAMLRQTLAQVEAQNGAVLVIDEADKLLGGAKDGAGDGGVTSRVFGRLLTWLAEKKDRTFVVMTLNSLDRIPPEFTRTGRFDRIFYTDFPGPKTRMAILQEHFRRYGLQYNAELWSGSAGEDFVARSRGYTGVEIEQAVIEAQCDAASRDTNVVYPDAVLEYLRQIPPVRSRYVLGDGGKTLTEMRTEVQKFATPVGLELPDDSELDTAGSQPARVGKTGRRA